MRALPAIVIGLATIAPSACSDSGSGGLADATTGDTSVATDATSGDSHVTTATDSSPTTTATDSAVATDSAPDTGPPTIGWAILQYPADHRGAPGSTLTVYGRVYVAGVTEGAGQGAGVEAEAGVGSGAVETWSWSAATFNVDADANDEYLAALTLPASEGAYAFAFRFRVTGGDWVYADKDGTDDGFDLADAGALDVVVPAPAAVDWCRLESPPTLAAAPDAPVGVVVGRVYEAGVSDVLSGDDASYPIVGELGFGKEADAVADWTWTPAAYARDNGNDDEFEASFAAPAVGAWRYAYRFRLDQEGAADWVYCDKGGADDGFAVSDAGQLTVAEPPVDSIDYATLSPASASWAAGETPATLEVTVYEAGRTPGAGQAAGIAVRVGYGAPDADLASFTWIDATYARDADGLGTLDNDVYAATLPSDLAVGAWQVVARVALDGGDAVDVDATGTPDGFARGDAAAVTVTAAAPSEVDWCQLLSAEQLSLAPSATTGLVEVRIYEAGVTPQAGTALKAEIGIGPVGTTPSDAWTWTAATFGRSVDNDDVWGATLAAPAAEGTVAIAARAALASSSAWRLCDRNGSEDGYQPDQATRVVVAAPRVDFCKIQWPVDDVSVSAGSPVDLYGAFYEAGVTGESGSHLPALTTAVGFGPVGSTPDASWTWTAGAFNGYLDNGFGQKNNDEHKATLTPSASGTFDWAWRGSLDGGAHWVLCDEAGSQPYDPAKAGKLVVAP